MIRGIGSQGAQNIFNNSSGSQKTKETSSNQSEAKLSKVEQIKASIESGEYKVDLDKLARKMAEDLS